MDFTEQSCNATLDFEGRGEYILFTYFFYFYFFFRERESGERKEKEWERNRLVASCMPPTGDLACNPGRCHDWESNRRIFSLQTDTQSTEPHQPG